MSDPSKVIVCGSHGEQTAAFVCQHLVRGFDLGFNFGIDPQYEDDPFPDAWCDECDARVAETNGQWTEESEKFAGITVICSNCYLAARLRNEPEQRRRRFTWTMLRNIEDEHREFPDTFELAPLDERNALTPETHVKLFFELDEPTDGAPRVERMWVRITEVLGEGHYKGTLENDPYFIKNISFGDIVEFRAKHVATILEPNPNQ